MKSKTKLSVFLLLLFAGAFPLCAQTEAQISINLANGTQKQMTLSQLKTLTFGTNTLSLNFVDGTSGSYALSEVETLTFSGIVSGIETLSNPLGILGLYPNPANDLLYLKGITEEEHSVTILSPEGRCQMQTRINGPGSPVDVSKLSTGLYLLKTNNQVLKFYKL